jgi:hypothetical protein
MRQEGWENRLEELVQSKRNQPFDWAENNCVGLVAEAQLTITGKTDFPEVLENIGNKHNAHRLILKHGKNITEGANKYFTAIPITMAQRGDIVELETCEGPAVGLCIGAKAVFIGKDGLEYIPLTSLIRAWRM